MKKIDKNLLYVLLFIMFETIFLKSFIYNILPNKYFLDAGHIIDGMNGISFMDKTYTYVANIFNTINVFNFTEIKQWGFFISLIFVPIIFKYLLKEKKYTIKQYVFIIASFTLLNIYVLGISKDIIQFVYFWFIYIILLSKKLSNKNKLVFSCVVLLYEALNFRVYYAIMAMMMVTCYFIYYKFIKGKHLDKKNVFKVFFLSFLLFFLEIYIVQFINGSNYDSILNARYSVNIWRDNDPNANTIINDLLGKNTNYLKFMGNYIINFIRLMFPVELIFKGPKQIMFMLYQLFITINIFKLGKKLNDNNLMCFIVVLSFFMISVIFEPDFGSFVRHESAMFLILLEMSIIVEKERINDEKNKSFILGEKNE